MTKFRQIPGGSDPFRTKTEAKDFAKDVRKRGRRAKVIKSGIFGKSRGFSYRVITGQKRK